MTSAADGKENVATDARAVAATAVNLAQLLPRVRAKQAARDGADNGSVPLKRVSFAAATLCEFDVQYFLQQNSVELVSILSCSKAIWSPVVPVVRLW